jgi:probable phosphoglycerate mutase
VNLLLIRHAEPDTGDGPRPDPPLSAAGRAQASALATWLAEDELAAVYTSPLRRARETAERRNGDPRYAALLTGDLALYGTDVATFRAAVVEAIDGVVDRHPGETVAVVSHAGVINAYLGAHLGVEQRLIWSALDYAGVTRVFANREGLRTISALNERAHHCGQPAHAPKETSPWPAGS